MVSIGIIKYSELKQLCKTVKLVACKLLYIYTVLKHDWVYMLHNNWISCVIPLKGLQLQLPVFYNTSLLCSFDWHCAKLLIPQKQQICQSTPTGGIHSLQQQLCVKHSLQATVQVGPDAQQYCTPTSSNADPKKRDGDTTQWVLSQALPPLFHHC